MNELNLVTNGKAKFVIRQIGAGGNGGYLFRNMLQMIAGYKVSSSDKFDITLIDGDIVEAHNLKNQLFSEEEVNQKKSFSLIDRYANHYDVDVKEYPKYVTSLEQLEELFKLPEPSDDMTYVPIILGMVDNDRTRQLLHEYFYSSHLPSLLWIDLGIEGTEVISNPSAEDLRLMRATGFSGQCVLGLKWKNEIILPPVTDVYENIFLAEDNFPGTSCGQVLPSNPQRMITNQTAAHVASMVLNTLFYTKSIFVSEINFNGQLGHIKPTYITNEQYAAFESLSK